MRAMISKVAFLCHFFLTQEDGQDLVEYALVVALVAFGAVSGMHTLATGLSGMFTKINAALTVV